jgi:sugar/nucleoside kinase (ribokinase family)
VSAAAEIVVLGNFVVDIIGKPIDRLPDRGRLLLIDTLETHPGGNGPNSAAALGLLGMPVAVVGRVGDDLYGRFLLERLREWRVEVSLVRVEPEVTTGITLVTVDSTGERSFIHHFGANAGVGAGELDWDAVPRARHFHLASFFVLPSLDGGVAAELLSEAHARGIATSLDVCWDRTGRWLENLRPCLPHLDYCMPSEEEARMLTGETAPEQMARALLAEGCGAVVVKLGERGCYYADRERSLEVPAFDVPVRDTTGAGDCFVGGFLCARLNGADVPAALRFGNACGARSVMAVGAVSGLASAREIEGWAAGLAVKAGAAAGESL